MSCLRRLNKRLPQLQSNEIGKAWRNLGMATALRRPVHGEYVYDRE